MNYNFYFIKLYFSLSTEDRKSFAIFVNRNYPNKRTFAKTLAYLKSLDIDGKNYDAEKLAKKVFKDKSKNKELGNLLSALDKKCREWLVLDDYQKNSTESKILLLDIFNRKGLSDEVYRRRSKEMQKSLEESVLKDMSSEYNKWKTTHDALFHSSFNHIQQREKEQLMSQAEENLDNFHLLIKLQYTYEKVVTRRLIETVDNEKIIIEANNISLNYISAPHPLIRFFALVVQLELTENINYYNTAKSLLSINDHLISPIQLPTYFTCLHNFAISSFKKKKLTGQHLFEFQRLAAERDWVTGGGQMPTVTFNNIVNLACLLKETEWVKTFIDKFSKKLPSTERNTITSIANARVFFSEKKYNKAALLLSSIDYNIDYATLRINSLLMCCHYEADKTDTDFLKSAFRNFQIQIENMKVINGKTKEGYLMFIKILQKFTNKNTDYQKLLIDVKHSDVLAYRDWLAEKIEEKLKEISGS